MNFKTRHSKIIDGIKTLEGMDGILLSELLPLLKEDKSYLKIEIYSGFEGFCQFKKKEHSQKKFKEVSFDDFRSRYDYDDDPDDPDFNRNKPIYHFYYNERGEGVLRNSFLIKEIEEFIHELEPFQDKESIDYIFNYLSFPFGLIQSIKSMKSDFPDMDILEFATLGGLYKSWMDGDLGGADAIDFMNEYGLEFKSKDLSKNIDFSLLSSYHHLEGSYLRENIDLNQLSWYHHLSGSFEWEVDFSIIID
jgi:hypothetical protein